MFFGGSLNNIVHEENEEQVKWIMQLMGYKKSVKFMEEAIQFFIPFLIITPLYNILICFAVVPSLGYIMFTLFTFVFTLEVFGFFALMRYWAGPKLGALIFVLLSFLQILVNIIMNV